MSTPFTLPLHTILDHEGRKIQYQGHLGDNLLSFTDVRSGSPVTVIDPVTGAKGMATFEWVAPEYAAGRLKRQTPSVVDRQGRQKEVARLDAAACIALDKKPSWRMGVELLVVDEIQHLRREGHDVNDVTDALSGGWMPEACRWYSSERQRVE